MSARNGRGTKSPRILLGVTSDRSLGLMVGLPESLVLEGWEVHVVSAPGEELDRLEGMEGVHLHSIPMERNPSPIRDLLALWNWIRVVRVIGPDVVSVGTPKAGLLGTLAAISCPKTRRVYLLRGLRYETSTGASRRILRTLEKITMRAAHKVLAVSPSLRALAISEGLVEKGKIDVLGPGSSNGVDLNRFDPESFDKSVLDELSLELGIIPGTPVVGYIGRLSRDKGIDTLVGALHSLQARGHRLQLVLVGSGEGEVDPADLGPIDQLQPAPIFTGRVEDVAPYLQLMDVLVLPTLREGFPNVVLEAHASGKPVITTNATGAVDSVVPNVNGLIFPVGETDELGRCLEYFLGKAKEFDSNTVRQSAKQFDRSRVQSRYRQYYEQLLERGSAPQTGRGA